MSFSFLICYWICATTLITIGASGVNKLCFSYVLLDMRHLACVASVSAGFSARSRHFLLFGGAKIGTSATRMEGAGLFCARPNFRAFKKRKMLQTCGKPYTTETLATQAM